MPLRRLAVLTVLIAATACAPQRIVTTDLEVPLAAPLEAGFDGAVGLEQDDPPARVVRLGLAEGGVAHQPAGMDEWAPAPVNLPLGPGDALWVPPGGRAELQAGSTGLRLGPGTDLRVLRLDGRAMQLGLARGALEVRIAPDREADRVEVATPDGAVLLARPGVYRVDVDPDHATLRVTVRSGLAELSASGATVAVDPGPALALAGGDAPSYDLVPAAAADGFDAWCAAREKSLDGSESTAYLGRDLIGGADLDGQGDWRIDPVLGTVWAPRVAAGWTPYRDGRWVWHEPWGWTWVDAAAWGFAPSHYGRWARSAGAWVWVPHAQGMKQAQPVYAPALAAFAGGPGLRGAAASGAGVAWFPLGPGEVYQPAYPASRAYAQAVNAASKGAAAAVAPGVPGAMTVVPQSVFLGARPVAGATLAAGGPVQGWRVGSAPGLVPLRESVLAAPAGDPPAARPPEAPARPLQVREPPPPAPVSFAARQRALAAGRGRPLSRAALDALRRQDPDARAIPTRLASLPAPGGTLRPVRTFPAVQPPAPRPGPEPAARPEGSAPPPAAKPKAPANAAKAPAATPKAAEQGMQVQGGTVQGQGGTAQGQGGTAQGQGGAAAAQGATRRAQPRVPLRRRGPGRTRPGRGGPVPKPNMP